MKCKMHLPGNIECPHDAVYAVSSPMPSGETARREVCVVHLGAAIDADMVQVSGVRVTMAALDRPYRTSRWMIGREIIYSQLEDERVRQNRQWGGAQHDDDHPKRTWMRLFREHLERAAKSKGDDWRNRLVVIGALCVAAIESHDRGGRA